MSADLAGLQRRYAAGLANQAEEVLRLWREWHAGSAPALAALRALLHRIIGTSGSYGFERVSSAAQALKDSLGERPAPPPHPALDALIATLRAPVATHRLD